MLVRQLVDQGTGALKDNNGYTHALNTVIREQLEEIWQMLQEEQANRQNPTSPSSDANLSQARKDELKALVKNLFEILNKSKCDTLDELRALIEGKSIGAKVNKAIDDVFIEEVIEKITNIIAVAIQSLIKEDQLQKLAYKFAYLANCSYEVGEPITKKQMKDEEHRIEELCGQILQTSIETAVAEQFDFTGKKQLEEANRYIQGIQTRSTEFFQKTKKNLEDLSAPGVDFNSKDIKNTMKTVFDATLAYESQSSADNFRVKGSQLNSDDKSAVGKRFLLLDQKSKELVQDVVSMRRNVNIVEQMKTIDSQLNGIKNVMQNISLSIARTGGATELDFKNCNSQIETFEKHLSEFKQMGEDTEQTPGETPATLQDHFAELHRALKAREFSEKLSQADSLVLQVANEKKQRLANAITQEQFQATIEKLKTELKAAFIDKALKQLTEKLEMLEQATTAEQVDAAYRNFIESKLVENPIKDFSAEITALGKIISLQKSVLANAVLDITQDSKMRDFYTEINTPTSLLMLLSQEKKQHLNAFVAPAELKVKLMTLKQQIQQTFKDDNIVSQLSAALQALDTATLPEQIDTARIQFLNVVSQVFIQSNVEAIKQRYQIAKGVIEQAINESHLLDANIGVTAQAGIRSAIAQARTHLQSFETWEKENIKEIPSISFSTSTMKGLQDWATGWATGLVYSRINERLDGLMKLLRREETYRYGILNHLVLIPYIQEIQNPSKPVRKKAITV